MKKIFLVVTISLLSISTYATHIIGGEISYKCLGGNLYEFTVKIYRDCYNGVPPLDNPGYFTIYNASNQVVFNDSFPILSDSILPVISPSPCLQVPPNLCVEEGTYIFTAVLPQSNGGYILAYQGCCRNASIVNLTTPNQQGVTYTAELNDAVLSLCNNSPFFINYPPIVICAGQPLVFDHSALDPDGDSLVYSLCQPYKGGETSTTTVVYLATPPPYQGVIYQGSYTASNPIDGNPSLAIDPVTGLLTLTPTVIGQFVVGVCVTEYRNGVYLGTHLRDFQFNVVNCQPTVVAALPSLLNNCSGFSFQFQNNSIGGIFYHWDFGVSGITNDTSNLEFPNYTYTDTGIYTITLMVNPGTICADTATSQVYVYPNLLAAMLAPGGCPNTPINFFDQSASTYGDINSWQWSFGDGDTSTLQNPIHTYANPGDYTVQLIVGTENGCADTVFQISSIIPYPEISLTPNDTTIIYGTSLQFLAVGGSSYSWFPADGLNNPNIANPIATPSQTTTYYLTITTSSGCLMFDSIIIHIVFEPLINIPNAFTPNHNGTNDFFRPLIIGVVANAEFKIYNRWGQLIYRSTDPYSTGWDGSFNGVQQEVGVYVYTFDCIGAKTGTPYHFKGNVTLLH